MEKRGREKHFEEKKLRGLGGKKSIGVNDG